MTITLEYLRSLATPSFGVGFVRQELLDDYETAIQSVLPNWRLSDRGRLARAIQALVETQWTHGEVNQTQALRTLWAFAVGNDLDVLAGDRGLERLAGESDEELRTRGVRAPLLASVGTLDRIEYNALQAGIDVVDAQANIRANRQDIDLWALQANHGILDATDQAALNTFLNRSDHVIMGTKIFIGTVTKTNYNIAVSVTFNSSVVDEGTLKARMTSQLQTFITDQGKLGLPINHSAIIGAATTPGTVSMSVTSPGSNLAATAGTVYIGGTISITATALT